MAKRDVVKLIRDFNAGRDPVRLAIKYRILRDNSFAFLRGTAHLFWSSLPRASEFKSPVAWLCGDLHLENFGCYKGDNRLTYFDLNDFDEAALAPCALEPLRLTTSLMVAAASGNSSSERIRELCGIFLGAYQRELMSGKSRWIERETASGMIGDLLKSVERRDRKTFLDSRCRFHAGQRRLALRENKLYAASDQQVKRVKKFMREFAAAQPNPEFFTCLDVANRIAGTGSLGVDRYAILVEGHGSPDRNYLLDLKQALPSALAPNVKQRQPKWHSEAERVVTVQRRVQAISPAFLQAVEMAGRPYVIRALQPTTDRLTLTNWAVKSKTLELALHNMGELVAWGQLRASGHGNAAVADELMEFAGGKGWKNRLLAAATACARQVDKDWYRFGAAYDDGAFG